MAMGKTHSKFNFLIFVVLSILLYEYDPNLYILSGFAIGYLSATFLLSPDMDLVPSRKLGPLRVFIYPYSLLFKHRGMSHSIIFGTLTRVLYLIIISALIISVLHQYGTISVDLAHFSTWAMEFIKGYDYQLVQYQLLTWTFLGLWMADFAHIFLDRLSSFFKRLKPF